MKYLIVGLGNIGADYANTRHNIGFDVVDEIARSLNAEGWTHDRYCYRTEAKYKGRIFVLIKPTTYMNLSGQAVRYWLQAEKLERSQLMVILDDLNLPLGKLRLRKKGSSGGHNGLKNIEEILQTDDYPRLRIGIGNDFLQGQQVDFVLGRWTQEEAPLVQLVAQAAAGAVKDFAFIGLERAMNAVNAKILTLPTPTPPTTTSETENGEEPHTNPEN